MNIHNNACHSDPVATGLLIPQRIYYLETLRKLAFVKSPQRDKNSLSERLSLLLSRRISLLSNSSYIDSQPRDRSSLAFVRSPQREKNSLSDFGERFFLHVPAKVNQAVRSTYRKRQQDRREQ